MIKASERILANELEGETTVFPSGELNQSIKDAIASGVYTDEQIELVKAQKRNVVTATTRTLHQFTAYDRLQYHHIHKPVPTSSSVPGQAAVSNEDSNTSSSSSSDAASSPSPSRDNSPPTTPVTSNPSASSSMTDIIHNVDATTTPTGKAPLAAVSPPPALDTIVNNLFAVHVGDGSTNKKRKQPPSPPVAQPKDGRSDAMWPLCTYMTCPSCRPTFRDRVWGHLDAYVADMSNPGTSSAGGRKPTGITGEYPLTIANKELGVGETPLDNLTIQSLGPRIIPVNLVRNIGLRKPIVYGSWDDVWGAESPGLEMARWDTAGMIRGDGWVGNGQTWVGNTQTGPQPSTTPVQAMAVASAPPSAPPSLSGSTMGKGGKRTSIVRTQIKGLIRGFIDRRDSRASPPVFRSASVAQVSSPKTFPPNPDNPASGALTIPPGLSIPQASASVNSQPPPQSNTAPLQAVTGDGVGGEEIDLGTPGLTTSSTATSTPTITPTLTTTPALFQSLEATHTIPVTLDEQVAVSKGVDVAPVAASDEPLTRGQELAIAPVTSEEKAKGKETRGVEEGKETKKTEEEGKGEGVEEIDITDAHNSLPIDNKVHVTTPVEEANINGTVDTKTHIPSPVKEVHDATDVKPVQSDNDKNLPEAECGDSQKAVVKVAITEEAAEMKAPDLVVGGGGGV